MNETLSLEAPEALEAGIPDAGLDNPGEENQTDTSEDSTEKSAERPIDIKERAAALDAWLTPLIAAHADTLVKAAWMGGAVTTLAEAIIAYPSKLIYADQEALMAEINALIAEKVTEPETPEAEENEAEDQTDETSDAAEADAKDGDSEQKDTAQKQTDKLEQAKDKADDSGQKQAQAAVETIEATNNMGETQSESSTSGNPTEQPLIPKLAIKNEIIAEEPKTEVLPEVSPQPIAISELLSRESVVVETRAIKKVTESIEEIDFEAPEADTPEVAEDDKLETAEVVIEETLVGESLNAEEDVAAEPISAELVEAEAIESLIDEEDQSFEALDIEVVEEAFIDFVDGEEIIISHFEEETEPTDYEPANILITEEYQGEPVDLIIQEEQTEVLADEASETPAEQIINEVEAEAVEENESSLVEALDKIDELSNDLLTAEEAGLEEDSQQELTEQLTELLDELGYEYTQESVEEIADLIIKKRLIEDIVDLKKDKETDELPHDIGTHEAIKQILIGLSQTKKAVPRIGKLAIKLFYASEFVLVLAA